MSRVLIAWELGANYGHLASCLRIAKALRERGHAVVFSVTDSRIAAELLLAEGFSFVQAPVVARKPHLSRPPINYSEVLLGEGYGDRLTLLGLVNAWRSLLKLCRPEVVLAEYAPSAMLAARSLNIPCLSIANGFGAPPSVSPLPSIRPWEAIPKERLVRADKALNDAIGAVMGTVGVQDGPTLAGIHENTLLSTFEELDPFGPRPKDRYIGPIFDLPNARIEHWTGGESKKVLAYLRPDMPGFSALMEALSAINANVICVVPGLRPERSAQFASRNLRIFSAPLSLNELLSDADAFVTYGGSNVVCQALLSGVPLVIAPRFVEQYLNARCAQTIGAAFVMGHELRRESFQAGIEAVLENATYRSHAELFAEKHKGYDVSQAIERTVKEVERLAGEHRSAGASHPEGA